MRRCGSGLLAASFLAHDYPVTGLDLSSQMLAYARANTATFTATGQAAYLQADAARYALAPRFGLAVATYDALNHLPDSAALQHRSSTGWRARPSGVGA